MKKKSSRKRKPADRWRNKPVPGKQVVGVHYKPSRTHDHPPGCQRS